MTGGARLGIADMGWKLSLLAVLILVPATAPAEPTPANALPEPILDKLAPGDRAQIEAARSELRAARAADAPDGELAARYGELGTLYLLHDFPDAAGAALEHARGLDPDEFRWLYFLGVLHQRQGDLERAAESFHHALALSPDDLPARLRLAEVRFDAGDLEAAAVHFRRALELEPRSAAAHWGIGRIAYEQQRYREAIEHLSEALALQPEATAIHHTLGLAHRQLGQLEAARRHLSRNTHVPVAFDDPLVDGLNRRLTGARVLVREGNRAVSAGDLERATAAFRAAVTADPSDPIAHYNLGRALLEQGERQRALEHLERAVDLDPGYRDAQFNLGVVLRETGRVDEAIRRFERALEIDPRDHWARVELARSLEAIGEEERAVRECQALLETEPLELEVELAARRLLARIQGRWGGYEAAARHYGEIVRLEPGAVEAHFGRALSLLLAAEHERALAALEQSVESLPSATPLRHLLARVLATVPERELRDGDRALRLALDVFEREPTVEHAETVAMAHAARGDFSAAVEWQRRVVGRLQQMGESTDAAVDRLARYERNELVETPWLDG